MPSSEVDEEQSMGLRSKVVFRVNIYDTTAKSDQNSNPWHNKRVVLLQYKFFSFHVVHVCNSHHNYLCPYLLGINIVIPHFLTACFLFTRHLSSFYRVVFSNFYIFISRYFINFFFLLNILHVYISAFYLYALQTFYSSFLKLLSA